MRALCLLCITAVLFAAGCSKEPAKVAVPNLPQSMAVNPPPGSIMLTANTYAGDALHKMLLLRMGSGGGILTTSFVDIHDFSQTSAFGRVAAQHVGSRLGQYGFRVIEARVANTLSMTPGPAGNAGEFMLTRESARLLADTYDANAVLVGCYSDNGNTVFVSTRVVRLSDNTVMGAYEYYLPRDADVSGLLAGAGGRNAAGGDGIWNRYNAREQAFAPGAREAAFGGAAPGAGNATAKSGRGGAVARAVPRYVDPVAAPASRAQPKAQKKSRAAPAVAVKKADPAPPQSPVASDAPVAPQKDAAAPEGVPGGNP